MLVCDSSMRVMWSFSSWKTWLRVERTRRKPLKVTRTHNTPKPIRDLAPTGAASSIGKPFQIVLRSNGNPWDQNLESSEINQYNRIMRFWDHFPPPWTCIGYYSNFILKKESVVFTSVAARNNSENKHPFILQSTMKTPNWTHICTNVLSSILIATGTNVLQKKKSWHDTQFNLHKDLWPSRCVFICSLNVWLTTGPPPKVSSFSTTSALSKSKGSSFKTATNAAKGLQE